MNEHDERVVVRVKGISCGFQPDTVKDAEAFLLLKKQQGRMADSDAVEMYLAGWLAGRNFSLGGDK